MIGLIGIGAVQQVELGVQGVPQEQLDGQLPGPDLGRQPAQRGLVLVGGRADHQLPAELLGQLLLEAEGRLVVHRLGIVGQAQRAAQLVLGQPLHAHQQPTGVAWAARPGLHQGRQLAPAAQVEVAHAEIGARGKLDRFLEGRQELVFDVIEDTRHWVSLGETGDRDKAVNCQTASLITELSQIVTGTCEVRNCDCAGVPAVTASGGVEYLLVPNHAFECMLDDIIRQTVHELN